MSQLSSVTTNRVMNLGDDIEKNIRGKKSVEEAAQSFTSTIYKAFEESILLCRLFITIPFKELPQRNTDFVNNLANSAGIQGQIKRDTLVLSLIGTSGKKPEWNDRKKSSGHVGIPLASSTFIDAIPMMSRLLKELGLGLDWIDSGDTDIVNKTMGKMGGVFYVPDAATTTDNKGRKIIAAQDFVNSEGVKSVFGIGGGYMISTTFLTVIVFLNETIQRGKAEAFMRLINIFKKETTTSLMANKIFLD